MTSRFLSLIVVEKFALKIRSHYNRQILAILVINCNMLWLSSLFLATAIEYDSRPINFFKLLLLSNNLDILGLAFEKLRFVVSKWSQAVTLQFQCFFAPQKGVLFKKLCNI